MKNKFNIKIIFFVFILIMIVPYILKPFSINILAFLVFGSFLSIIFIGWSTSIRNFKKGTFSLNPITQAKASAESNLNQFEILVLKYSATIIFSTISSFVFYFMIEG